HLTSSCGWKETQTISFRLSFVLANPLSNAALKNLYLSINERAQFKLLDPAVCSASQPHFTASPIITLPAVTPFKIRSGNLYGDNEYLDLDLDTLILPSPDSVDTKKVTPSKIKNPSFPKKYKPLYQVTHKALPHNWKDWMAFLNKTCDGELHNNVRSFTCYLAATHYWGLSKTQFKQFKKALTLSPRFQGNSTKAGRFLKSSEYLDLYSSAYERKFWTDKSNYLAKSVEVDSTQKTEYFETEIPVDKTTLLIISSLGTGKTTWIEKTFFDSQSKYFDDNAIVITPSRALNLAWCERNPHLSNYETIKETCPKGTTKSKSLVKYLSVCVNSLINEVINTNLPSNPILILDECEAIFEQLFGGTVKSEDRDYLLCTLQKLFDDAKLIVLAQHNVTQLTYKFLAYFGIERDDVYTVKNTTQRYQNTETQLFQSDSAWLEKLHKTIGEGIPCMVACNEREGGAETVFQGIRNKYPEKKGLLITSSNKKEHEQAAFLNNADAEIEQYEYLVYSPTLSHGVSITSDKFQHTFGLFSSTAGNKPSDCTQMLFRARKVKNLYIHCDTDKQATPTEPKHFLGAALHAFYFLTLTDPTKAIETGFPKIIKAELHLHSEILFKGAVERGLFFDNLVMELSVGMGCRLDYIAKQGGHKEGKQIKKEALTEVKSHHQVDILQAGKLDDEDYEKACERSEPETENERKRYELEKTMRIQLDLFPVFRETEGVDFVEDFNAYKVENHELAQLLIDYDEGRIQKKHLFLSEICLSETEAVRYAKQVTMDITESTLDLTIPQTFPLRRELFKHLLPLVNLQVVNGSIERIAGTFSYLNVLKDKALMSYCTTNASALQLCYLSKFKDKPSVQLIGLWLRNVGLNPLSKRVTIKDKKVTVRFWDTIDTASTRLLSRYNAVFDNPDNDLDSVLVRLERALDGLDIKTVFDVYDCLEPFKCDIPDEIFTDVIKNVSTYEGHDFTVDLRIQIIDDILYLVDMS
ncbi:MAG: DEAD/DEAH box helicase family protein, partial [Thiomargarita sp.]|nr:DEAD/DEAH box helicase family protein [Thiomargarita sp.]